MQLFVGYIRLKITLRFSQRAAAIRGKICVAVILTHNRPQNIWLLVQGAVRNRFVTRVIVSNSNPRVKIRDWVQSADPRLTLIDETILTQPGHRLALATETTAECALSIDEDIFLTAALLCAVLAEHGIKNNVLCKSFSPAEPGPPRANRPGLS